MNIIKYSIFIFLFAIHSFLYSAISYSASASTGQIVPGYFNGSNQLTFTVTFTDGDATTYNGGFIKLYVSWAESGNAPGDPNDVIGNIGNISNGSATVTLTSSQISTTNAGLPQGDNFDIKIEYRNGGTVGSVNVDEWGNVDDGNYLTYETDSPWVSLYVWRADGWSDWGDDGETFSTQRVYINPDETLNNHGGTYNNYIYFINTDDEEYRYKIGTVASQLDVVGEPIELTSNVEKYNTEIGRAHV